MEIVQVDRSSRHSLSPSPAQRSPHGPHHVGKDTCHTHHTALSPDVFVLYSEYQTYAFIQLTFIHTHCLLQAHGASSLIHFSLD